MTGGTTADLPFFSIRSWLHLWMSLETSTLLSSAGDADVAPLRCFEPTRCGQSVNLAVLSLLRSLSVVCGGRFLNRVGLCDRYTESQMIIGGTFISLVVGYALGCLPYILFDWFRWQPVGAYKLQPNRYVSLRVRWSRCRHRRRRDVRACCSKRLMGRRR